MTFSEDQLAAMRATHAQVMGDTCQVGTIGTTQNSIGELVMAAPAYGRELACGLQMLTPGAIGAEFRTGEGTFVRADAVLRLPYGTAVTTSDVVKVTKRHGEVITPLVYEVLGLPATGASGILCYLRQVTT